MKFHHVAEVGTRQSVHWNVTAEFVEGDTVTVDAVADRLLFEKRSAVAA